MTNQPQQPECARGAVRPFERELDHYSEQLSLATNIVERVFALDARIAAEQAFDRATGEGRR